MSGWKVLLDAAALNRVLAESFPGGGSDPVSAVSPGRVRLSVPFESAMLRPGGLVSGATLMSITDTASYALVMAHVGPELMAVTSSLTIHFLRGAPPGTIEAEAELMTLGRRLAVCDVRLWTEAPDRLAARATVTYARATA